MINKIKRSCTTIVLLMLRFFPHLIWCCFCSLYYFFFFLHLSCIFTIEHNVRCVFFKRRNICAILSCFVPVFVSSNDLCCLTKMYLYFGITSVASDSKKLLYHTITNKKHNLELSPGNVKHLILSKLR